MHYVIVLLAEKMGQHSHCLFEGLEKYIPVRVCVCVGCVCVVCVWGSWVWNLHQEGEGISSVMEVSCGYWLCPMEDLSKKSQGVYDYQ